MCYYILCFQRPLLMLLYHVLRFVCTVLYENRSAEHYAHICIFRRDFDRRIPGHSVKEGWREMFRVLCCVDSGFDIRAHQVPQMLKKRLEIKQSTQ